MRITIILLTIGLHVNASIYSQSKKFDLNVKNLPLREVFKEIESKSQFHFLFGDNLLLLDKVVNVNLENSNVEQALDKLLANSDYSYKVLENNLIVIAPENFINRQNKKVTGIILDAATGDPLPGVSILQLSEPYPMCLVITQSMFRGIMRFWYFHMSVTFPKELL